MIVQLSAAKPLPPNVVIRMRCPNPNCRQLGTFDEIGDVNDLMLKDPWLVFGQRCCPDTKCRTHVFFVIDMQHAKLLASYPPERIDFDTSDIPEKIVNAMEEAITCHASECFAAAAMLVRKTVEELCEAVGAKGEHLKDRIEALRTHVTLSPDLLEGVDELRMLGNDAVHVKAKTFNEIGKEEVELGIMFAKRVLEAVYQHKALVARIRALKKTPAT